MIKQKYVRKDCWQSLGRFFRRRKVIRFLNTPANALVKIRYGLGKLSIESPEKIVSNPCALDLYVHKMSVVFAQVMIKVDQNARIEYEEIV